MAVPSALFLKRGNKKKRLILCEKHLNTTIKILILILYGW